MNWASFMIGMSITGFLIAILLILTWYDIHTTSSFLKNRELDRTTWYAVTGLCACVLVFGLFFSYGISTDKNGRDNPIPITIVVTATPRPNMQ